MPTKVGGGSVRAVETKSPRHPCYRGSITINDQKYWLSGWKRQADDGSVWLSLSVEEADEDITAAKNERTFSRRRDPAF
jgi:hypothetical protein